MNKNYFFITTSTELSPKFNRCSCSEKSDFFWILKTLDKSSTLPEIKFARLKVIQLCNLWRLCDNLQITKFQNFDHLYFLTNIKSKQIFVLDKDITFFKEILLQLTIIILNFQQYIFIKKWWKTMQENIWFYRKLCLGSPKSSPLELGACWCITGITGTYLLLDNSNNKF